MSNSQKNSTRTSYKNLIKLGTASCAALMIATGCVVAPEGNPPPSDENRESNSPTPSENPQESNGQEILASTNTSSVEIGHDLQIDIYSLESLNNDLLRLNFGVTNNSSSSFRINRGMANDGDSYAVSAVTLLDTVNQKRHLTFTEGSDNCFCSYFDGAIQSGETVEMWAYFPAVPEGSKPVETMTVTTPIAPPLLDIPVTESSDEVDTPNLSSPEILDLTAISESLGEDQTGRTEDDDEISILLSSDVLFETNSASLNPEAEEILEQVAQEIDDASDISVNVDGHADDTGDDEINDPLSLERAEAVESELSQLITRDNVSFEVEGHGSSDPIANNGTEEGRERNRRVSVTFEK